MTNEISLDDLKRVLWAAADSSRTNVDSSVFKDYVLTFLFYKYLSDKHKVEKNALKQQFGQDEERLKAKLELARFRIPAGAAFDDIFAQQNADNIGELINRALAAIEENNEERLGGIFTVDFNSQAILGQTSQRNKMLRDIINDFAKIDLSGVKNDILGSAYMYMIEQFGSGAGKKAGEFFSPHSVAELLAKLAGAKPGDRICDPACGSGSLLLLTAKEVGNKDYALYGQEKMGSTYNLARMNMFLHSEDSARIEWGDTLNAPKLLEQDNLMKFDIVVANPPFSLDKWGEDKLNNDKYDRFWRGMPPKSKGDYAFISHMIETAKAQSGRVAVIVPHGVLFRGASEGKIRESLIKDNLLDAVIGLPAGLFQTTGIPVAILIFDRSREVGGANADKKDVLFIDASKEYKSGKNQNTLEDEHTAKILDAYKTRAELERFSRRVAPSEIAENDYNLNIPRYIDTFEPEPEVDLVAVQAEIAELDKKLAAASAKMSEYLQQLGLKD